jgi:hypothetical protein
MAIKDVFLVTFAYRDEASARAARIAMIPVLTAAVFIAAEER